MYWQVGNTYIYGELLIVAGINLHEKQGVALKSEATEILYGGAAGGGKSFLMRIIAIIYAESVPGLQVYLFRRTWPDLERNHLAGSGNFYELLQGRAKITGKPATIRFSNGSKIHLCHCQNEADVHNYQGAEIHVLLIDELTHFTEYMYRFLRGRVRLGGLKVGAAKGKLPFILAGSNPGDIGHQWVKAMFVDYAPAYQIVKTPKNEGGMLRQFIPARLEDNPTMTENDPLYAHKLEGLGNPDLVKAMLEGDWDITAGSALEKLSRNTHMVDDFEVPKWWTRFMSIDWGYSAPFSVGWYTVADSDVDLKGKYFLPQGCIIRYRELYGWNGQANQGSKMDADEVAKMIIDIEETNGEKMDYRIGDSAMWATQSGPSVEKQMYESTDGLLVLQKSKKDRVQNYQAVRNYIAGIDGVPMFYATESCRQFWRTVPTLQLDKRNPLRGPDSDMEDHCLVAGTKVKTEHGDMNIEDIETGTLVLTTNGYFPCINLGQTAITDKIYVMLTTTGVYKATGSHLFLTASGTYVRLDELCKNMKLYQIQSRSLWERLTGYVEIIFKDVGLGFIGWCGNFIMRKFRKGFMSTTRIIIEPTTVYPIWNSSPLVTISSFTPTPRKLKLTAEGQLNLLKEKQKSGTSLQRVGRLIAVGHWAENISLNMTRNVKIVMSHLKQNWTKLNIALQNARHKPSENEILAIYVEKGKRPVYNLHVPKINNFCLSDGTVVHNCYDELSYALCTEPAFTTREERIFDDYNEARKNYKPQKGGYAT